jgi:spore coat polysaccharide biosynthesis predicted glycosyltransferase SpsG
LPETCTALLGPRFALLRPEFGQMRAQTDTRSGKVSRILVCFGGSDPSNQTAKALAAVARLPAIPSGIDVAIGMSHPHRDSVAALCRELPGAKLHHGARNMAELMAQADLAIGAGGVMCWERCCLGLPTVALHIAENQVNSLTALADREALIYLGSADAVGQTELVEAVAELMADAARTKRMGELAQRLVDGGGGRRVSAAIIG